MKKNSNKIAKILIRCLIGEGILLAIVIMVYVGIVQQKKEKASANSEQNVDASTQVFDQQITDGDESGNTNSQDAKGEGADQVGESGLSQEETVNMANEVLKAEERKQLLEKAEFLALGYDYDSAIQMITAYEDDYEQYEELTEAVVFIL